MTKEKKPQIVTIDEVEYNAEDFSQEQATMFNHCVDLDRKISSTRFQIDQLIVGKDAFLSMLKASLSKQEEATTIDN